MLTVLRCLLCLWFVLGFGLALSAQDFPIHIIDQSGITPSPSSGPGVYIFIKAYNPSTKNAQVVSSNPSTGNCTLVDATENMDLSLYSYKLTPTFPTTLNFPPIISARLYFSINSKMEFYVTKDNLGHFTIPDPNPFDPRDANYYLIYDKMEFTFVVPGGSYANPTGVDFFSLPLYIEQPTSTSFTQSGLNQTQLAIIQAIQADFDGISDAHSQENWKRLVVSYTDPSGTSAILRIVSPSKGILPGNNNAPYFDNSYLSNSTTYGFDYVDAINNYYQNNTIVIDCTELQGVFNMGPNVNDYFLTGYMLTPGEFFFNNTGGTYSFNLTMPTDALPYFAGAGESFTATDKTPPAIIVRQLTTAFDVGLLPAPNNQTIDAAYFLQEKNNNNYYQDNPLLAAAAGTGPWYDIYAKALHALGTIYAFAYDDAAQQDGTLHDPSSNPGAATVTIGSLAGVTIPNALIDPNLYNVTLNIGQGSVVYYQNKPYDSGSSPTFNNVKSPFDCLFNGNQAFIYVRDGFVLPYFFGVSGILVNHGSGNDYTIIFPGNQEIPPKPSPVPTSVPTSTVRPTPPIPLPTVTATPVPSPTPSSKITYVVNDDGTCDITFIQANGGVKTRRFATCPQYYAFAPESAQEAIDREAQTIINSL